MLCEYGCGREALYQPEKERRKWCCSEFTSQCPTIVEKAKLKNTGKKRNEEAKNNLSLGRKGIKNKAPLYLPETNEKCCYCGDKANYYFTITKKWCCESNYMKCPINKEKFSKKFKGHIVSNETKQKISKKIIEINQTNLEYKIKQSTSRKLKIKDIQERYKFFSKIEEMRENPKTGDIQFRCKNSNCENSKERDGWFTPTKTTNVYERIRALEKDWGNDGQYLYCSEECKNSCKLYNVKTNHDPLRKKEENEKFYTTEEYDYFREFVLERDNCICQYCGSLAEHVHHEKPQKLEPFFSLDPDYAWSVCKKCHYGKAHKKGTECGTYGLSIIVCN